jgi:hypothetical protein
MLSLTKEQRNELDKSAGSRTLPAGDVFRARLILALAEGQPYSQIMTSLQTSAPTISRWKQRFEEEGLAGLDPRHKGSQPRVAVELWFAKIQRDVIARGVFTSVADLGNKLRKYIRAYSKSAKPFRWTYTDPTRRIRSNKIAGTAYYGVTRDRS